MHENFFHKLKVYYEDTDSGGVVYYANYLKYLERARTEALFSIGFSNKKIKDQFNSLIIVKSCKIEYKKPAYLEDYLSVRSFVKQYFNRLSHWLFIFARWISNRLGEDEFYWTPVEKRDNSISISDIIKNQQTRYNFD